MAIGSELWENTGDNPKKALDFSKISDIPCDVSQKFLESLQVLSRIRLLLKNLGAWVGTAYTSWPSRGVPKKTGQKTKLCLESHNSGPSGRISKWVAFLESLGNKIIDILWYKLVVWRFDVKISALKKGSVIVTGIYGTPLMLLITKL